MPPLPLPLRHFAIDDIDADAACASELPRY